MYTPNPNEIKVGQVYHDIGGERRNRAVGRYIEVVSVGERFVFVKNTATNRHVQISRSRLVKPFRFALVTTIDAPSDIVVA